MNVTARVNPSDVRKLTRMMERIAANTRKELPDLTKQSMIFALQSATKATEPGTSGKASKLPQKYKFRRLVKQPSGSFYYINIKTGFIFDAKQKPKRAKQRGLRRAKSIEIWSKKKGGFDYLPTAESKRNKSKKIFKVPHAGAGKAGWTSALKLLGKPGDTGEEKKDLSRLAVAKNATAISMEVTNLVDYVAITSPESARKGLAAATKRIEKIYLPKLEKKIERTFYR